MKIHNVVEDCCCARPTVPLRAEYVKYLVWHRTDLRHFTEANPDPIEDVHLTGPELCRRFRNHGLGTGGRPPYHVLILVDGTIDQCLPLLTKGAHASGYNLSSWGVAVVGDMRYRTPTDAQWVSIIDVGLSLGQLGLGLDFVGHTVLPGASADPHKICPGKYLRPDAISHEVARRLAKGWSDVSIEKRLEMLAEDGWQLTSTTGSMAAV